MKKEITEELSIMKRGQQLIEALSKGQCGKVICILPNIKYNISASASPGHS